MGIKTLAKQSSHYLAGQVAMMLLGFASFPIFTRVLEKADYGTIDLISRLVLLGTALGKLGVQNAVIRFYDAKAKEKGSGALAEHVSTAIVGTGLSGLLVGVLLAIAFFYTNVGGTANLPLAAIAGVLALLRIEQAILMNVLRVEERTQLYTVATVGMRVLTLAAIFGLFYFRGKGLETYFAGSIAMEALVLGALAVWLIRRGLLSWRAVSWPGFGAMVAFGAPMIAYECLTVMMDAGDRVLINYFLGADELASYTVAFGLCLYIHDLMMVPINMALTPLYLRIWSSEGAQRTSEFLGQSLRMYVMAAFGLFAGVVACSYDAVIILASTKYAGSTALVPWVAAGMFLYASTSFFNAGLMIHKKTKTLALFSLAVVVLKLALNGLLLPRLGLNGAVIATVSAYMLYVALAARWSMDLLPLRIDFGNVARAALACAVACAGANVWRIDSHIWSFLVKGTCAVTIYGAILAIVDKEARHYLKRGWGIGRARCSGLVRRFSSPRVVLSER